ncbi:MAG: valine--tRNA ligase [bacterium]|nr:valine--tRNA ligase [bacterium]
MPELLEKAYDPKAHEGIIYEAWERSGFFNPDNLPGQKGEPFCIIMPPLNANAPIHAGHALVFTIEDVLIRYHRMKGERTLWLPGIDHAGFETQVVFEKKLEKEGRSRFKMERKEFYKEIWNFVQEQKHVSEAGIRRMGASCDWSRNIFTLDPRIVKIVYETFKEMSQDGLVYRGERISNWCTKHQTTLSDLETNYEEREDPLYYIKYGPFELATVRPETKFGDTAVAVNPNDERYKKFVGEEIEIETVLGKAKLKVIADLAVDPEFGTGVVKVTPAHDTADFEIWQRHKDDIPGPRQVIDKYGRMNELAGPYKGLKVGEARTRVVEDLEKKGLIAKTDPHYKHNVQLCYKCGTVIEPLIMPQWYVAMTKPLPPARHSPNEATTGNGRPSLRDMAVRAVESKAITILPKWQEKTFMHWMKELRDWPISRQIWWGIPIPVKYCSCGEVIVDIEDKVKECPRCKSSDLKQDPDTFDTWFSSGQWPYAALMAHGERDFKTYYPTSVMETGWDILFFWVARMIMLSYYKTDKAPFKIVYLHGLVRDKDKQKMSKSKGNAVDPLGVVETYGTDALRFALIFATAAGHDIALSEDRIRGMKHFANKLWNIARFILANTEESHFATKIPPQPKTNDDRAVLAKLAETKEQVTGHLDRFELHEAAQAVYHFVWHELADVYLEKSKLQLGAEEKERTQEILAYALSATLKLLHPFMPFVTEAIYQKLPHKEQPFLMVERW